jgi:formylglycine-generating enzyme required for sulfatase activity
VWEWCRDAARTYDKNTALTPETDPEGRGEEWVLRGGSWIFHAFYARSAFRYVRLLDERSHNLGFRVVLRFPIPSQAERGMPGGHR